MLDQNGREKKVLMKSPLLSLRRGSSRMSTAPKLLQTHRITGQIWDPAMPNLQPSRVLGFDNMLPPRSLGSIAYQLLAYKIDLGSFLRFLSTRYHLPIVPIVYLDGQVAQNDSIPQFLQAAHYCNQSQTICCWRSGPGMGTQKTHKHQDPTNHTVNYLYGKW